MRSKRISLEFVAIVLTAAVLTVALVAASGCRKKSRAWEHSGAANPHRENQMREELLDIAIEGLGRIEEYETDEALNQILNRLNQWLQTQKADDGWSVDPMAAPLFKSLVELHDLIAPIEKNCQAPRNQIELKSLARQFATIPSKLDEMRGRLDLKKTEALAARHEQVIQQMEAAAKLWGDAAKLAEVEAKMPEVFSGEVRDKVKLARLYELIALAKGLDWPNRLRDPMHLGPFAEQIEFYCRAHDPKELKSIIKTFSDAVNRRFGPAGRTKLLVQLEFLGEQLDEISAWKELAGLRLVQQLLSQRTQQLKSVAERSGRDDIRQLAVAIEAAVKKSEFDQVTDLVHQFESLIQPNRLDDMGPLPQQFDDIAQQLVQAAATAEAAAKNAGQESFENLAAYCRRLGERFAELARKVKSSSEEAKAAPSDLTPQDLDALTVAVLDLGGRLEILLMQLSYFVGIGELRFPRVDIAAFEEAVVSRDLSRWARGEDADDVSRAKRLFDWTVRNVQLEAEQSRHDGRLVVHVMQMPWETMFFGRGTWLERAWVFVLLARQQGLETALLAVEESSASGESKLRPWAIGVLSEGNVFVFDPTLGLPIPGPGGLRLDEQGQLDIQPATLAQLAGDDRLLRQLDLGSDRPYPLKASDLKRVVALIDGTPWWLSQRMRAVETRLGGENRMVLSIAPSANASRWSASPGVSGTRLWTVGYETTFQRIVLGPEFAQWQMGMMAPFTVRTGGGGRSTPRAADSQQAPMFWETSPEAASRQTRSRQGVSDEAPETLPLAPMRMGRLLHLRGRFTGQPSATWCYQIARVSDRQLAEFNSPETAQQVELLRLAKQHATYWLGLLAYEQRNYPSARDYLLTRTLEASPQGPWIAGAKYNLGRVYEAEKQYALAIQQYRSNSTAIDEFGNRLRARWLEKLVKPADLDKNGTKGRQGGDQAGDLPELPALPGLPDMPAQPKIEPPPKPETQPKTATPTKVEGSPKVTAPPKLETPSKVKEPTVPASISPHEKK